MSGDTPANPAAFPSRVDRPMLGGGSYRDDRPGMMLRDWFAGQALAGLMSNEQTPFAADVADVEPIVIAEACYDLADAMLAARATASLTQGDGHGG